MYILPVEKAPFLSPRRTFWLGSDTARKEAYRVSTVCQEVSTVRRQVSTVCKMEAENRTMQRTKIGAKSPVEYVDIVDIV